MKELMKKVIFLDRDGTICDDKGAFHKKVLDYESLINNISLIDGVLESIKLAKDNGFLIIVISNQAGVAKGKFRESAIHRFNKNLNDKLDSLIDGFYYCPHHDTGYDVNDLDKSKYINELIFDCDCRKPNIGMFLQAEKDLSIGKIQYIDDEIINNDTNYILDRNVIYKKEITKCIIDKNKSFMIGDKTIDTLAGKNYGIVSYLVRTGEGKEEELNNKVQLGINTDYVVDNINIAIKNILSKE